ncbi:hypothetical protein TNCV_3949051 [Trichonephila clavipes]|nr:hypothetical protein TNCV_3949051 [Trichonephila clavipes]
MLCVDKCVVSNCSPRWAITNERAPHVFPSGQGNGLVTGLVKLKRWFGLEVRKELVHGSKFAPKPSSN